MGAFLGGLLLPREALAFIDVRQAKGAAGPAGASPEVASVQPPLSSQGRIERALRLTKPVDTVRLAFEVELKSSAASRRFSFDPRRPEVKRTQMLSAVGRDKTLEDLTLGWMAQAAPDARLVPDLLRTRMANSQYSKAENGDLLIRFAPTALPRDAEDLAWMASYLDGEAVLPASEEGFSSIRYRLAKPLQVSGGALRRNDQSYQLASAPQFGLSFIEAFSIEARGQIAFRTIEQSLNVQVLAVEPFFAVRSSRGPLRDKALPRL
jgi:hypothetical protein